MPGQERNEVGMPKFMGFGERRIMGEERWRDRCERKKSHDGKGEEPPGPEGVNSGTGEQRSSPDGHV